MNHLRALDFFFIYFCLAAELFSPIFATVIEQDQALAFYPGSISSVDLNEGFAIEGGSAGLGMPAIQVGGGDGRRPVDDVSEVEHESYLTQYQRQFEDVMEASPQPDLDTDIPLDLTCNEDMCSSGDQEQLTCDISDLHDDEQLPLDNDRNRNDILAPADGILNILDTPPFQVPFTTAQNDENTVFCSRSGHSSGSSVFSETNTERTEPTETPAPVETGKIGTGLLPPIGINGTEGNGGVGFLIGGKGGNEGDEGIVGTSGAERRRGSLGTRGTRAAREDGRKDSGIMGTIQAGGFGGDGGDGGDGGNGGNVGNGAAFGRPFGTCCRPCTFLRGGKGRSLSCCMSCSLLR